MATLDMVCERCRTHFKGVAEMQLHVCSAGAESVLAEAARIVDGPRRETYGTPKENHERTAAMWSAYLGRTITAQDVCMLNILQKLSRAAHQTKGPHHLHRDTLVDIAGYARNAELVIP